MMRPAQSENKTMSDKQIEQIEAGGIAEVECTRCELKPAVYILDEDHALCEDCQGDLEVRAEGV